MTRKKQKRSRKNRSSTKERRSKPPETLSEYDEAVAIYTYHVEEKGRADLAVEMAQKAITDTASLLERLSTTPMGRRAVVTDVVNDFDSLRSVYSEAFVDLLTKKD